MSDAANDKGQPVPSFEAIETAPAEADAPFVQRMAHRVATRQGRARYKLRQQTVEPTFGTIKDAMGFRRFRLRGKKEVSSE